MFVTTHNVSLGCYLLHPAYIHIDKLALGTPILSYIITSAMIDKKVLSQFSHKKVDLIAIPIWIKTGLASNIYCFQLYKEQWFKIKIQHDIKYTFAFSECCIQYEPKKNAVEVQLKHIS